MISLFSVEGVSFPVVKVLFVNLCFFSETGKREEVKAETWLDQ